MKVRLFTSTLALAILVAAAVASPPAQKNFIAIVNGDNERPVPRETRAHGVAQFQLSEDGTELYFRLIVANIENVTASHIHVGDADTAGPVVVPLIVGLPVGSGRFSGVLAEGAITAADLTGPMAGQTLDDLIALIESGDAYVNVHTNDGVAPINTGPGDFPGGEIRGQIR